MSNDNKINLKADHGAHNHKQSHKRGLLISFIIFMAWVAGVSLLISLVACTPVNTKPIATHDSSGYYIDLSKISSGQASRDILAFFVPDNSTASQAVTIQSSIAPPVQISTTRGQYLISMAATLGLPTSYDGLTLQNTIAERRICKAVTTNTESKTRHPISLLYSVALTHKLVGGSYHG